MAKSLNDDYEPVDRYKAVVDHTDGLLVVAAGPGTGKTFSLLRKIEKLLTENVDATQIYYLTFVNSIVDAFKNDIAKEKSEGGLGVDADKLGIHVSTLHSLALKIVKTYSEELGTPDNLELVELSARSKNMLSRLLYKDLCSLGKDRGAVSGKMAFDKLISGITDNWRRARPTQPEHEAIEDFVKGLTTAYIACPYDMLVLLAIRAISKNGLPSWLKSAEHYLIDEFQDFNPAEQTLINLITEPSDSVVIVGDPDQSIYSGRSASPAGIQRLLDLEETFTVNFVYCRRCPKKVIRAANNMLRQMNPDNFDAKRLYAHREDEGAFSIVSYKSCKAEVADLTNVIRREMASGNNDVVMLFRSKEARNFYCSKLADAGIKCSAPITDERHETLLAILRLVLLKSQPLTERLVLHFFSRLESFFTKRILFDFIQGNSSILESLVNCSPDIKKRAPVVEELRLFEDALIGLRSDDAKQIVSTITDLGFDIELEFVEELLNTDPDAQARDRIEEAQIIVDYNPVDAVEDAPEVSLLTMHSSKGLSKRIVIIPAFEDKWLPGAVDGERQRELERLLYVAVTRATEKVLITFPYTRAGKDPLRYIPNGTKAGISRYASVLMGK